MKNLLNLVPMYFIAVIGGCSSPEYANYSDLDYTSDNHEKMLEYYIDGAQEQLLSLGTRTQGRCINGQMAIAHSLFDKAQTEYQHNMYKDAFITLGSFDRHVRKTYCILSYLEGNFGCKLTNKSHLIKEWYEEGRFEQCQVKPESVGQQKQKVFNSNEIVIEMLHDHDSPEIKPLYFSSLNKAAALLTLYPESLVTIVGHADSTGGSEYNKNLGKQRAEIIAEYLVNKGVLRSNLTLASQGEENIREFERNDVSRVFNRYTEVKITLKVHAIIDSQGENDG